MRVIQQCIIHLFYCINLKKLDQLIKILLYYDRNNQIQPTLGQAGIFERLKNKL